MEKWIATAVGMMHIHGIKQSELAEKMGIRRDYLNKILNGKHSPSGAKERIEGAIKELISINK
jgi:DNA-binding transcriptional regulator LsrR (DeoR family)